MKLQFKTGAFFLVHYTMHAAQYDVVCEDHGGFHNVNDQKGCGVTFSNDTTRAFLRAITHPYVL
jgi:hypothetical protein